MPMSVEEYRIAQLYMIQVRAAPSEDAGKEAQRGGYTCGGVGVMPARASRGREGGGCPAAQMVLHVHQD